MATILENTRNESHFLRLGKCFQNQTEINEFQNVSVYPLVAEILGLKISEPIDGKFSG